MYRVAILGVITALLIDPFASAHASAVKAHWDVLPQLTKEDISLAKKTGREDMSGKPPGTVLSWINPKSGNSGTVQLIEYLTWENKYKCRKLISFFNLEKEKNQRWETVLCRMKDGSWKWPVPPKRLQ